MNGRARQMTLSERRLVEEALTGLRMSTRIEGELLHPESPADGQICFHIAGKSLRYDCEVKHTVDRFLALEGLKARSAVNEAALLVCPVLTSALAARCHDLGIQFIDTAGNAYITDGAGILVNVIGRKQEKDLVRSRDATVTPAALRILFGALAEPSILNAPYRVIAPAVRVSTGAIAKALETLEAKGLIARTPAGKLLIRSPEVVLSEWTTGYLHRIRPKLRKMRFTSDKPDELRKAWSPGFRESAWSGEVAAEVLTQHLNPATFTIYMDMENTSALSDLVKTFRLRADPAGAIEVVQPFWDMDRFAESFPTVPLHLVYADLLGTYDSRNVQLAEQIFSKVVAHVHDSQRKAT